MDHFQYHDKQLYAEAVPIVDIVKRWGTPCFIYSRATLERHWHVFNRALGDHPHLICYAVKANSNLAVLNVLARLGSGFDIVSRGELERVLAAGGDPKKIVFSGVGKLTEGIERALEVGVHCFNVESEQELLRLNNSAIKMGKKAQVAIRVNPDIDPKTHPYIATGLKENKFGIAINQALPTYQQAAALPNLEIIGVDCHIGSQLTEIKPFQESLDRVIELVKSLQQNGINIQHIDIGGGLGVRYQNEQPPEPAEYAKALLQKLADNIEIIVEPGRAIAGNAGILVTRVEYLKHTQYKNFAIVDAAMNDLLRPALYNAWQEIIPVIPREAGQATDYDIVGPVCETGDFLGKNRKLVLLQNDLLAIRTAGAYSFTMSSNYNSRPRAPEIMVDGDRAHLVRPRETIQELYAQECLLPL